MNISMIKHIKTGRIVAYSESMTELFKLCNILGIKEYSLVGGHLPIFIE